MKTKSRIFGDKELEMVKKRLEGDKSDPNGLYRNCAKPKLIEIVEIWFPKIKEIKEILEKKKVKK